MSGFSLVFSCFFIGDCIMIRYLVFDLDGTLIRSQGRVSSLVARFFEERFWLDPEATRYYFHSTRGKALIAQIMEYLQIQEDEARKLSDEIYSLILQTKKGEFFPGVVEKIKELSQDFKLFLSTGNSTAFAKENLQEWWILNCFELVVGSDLLIKGVEHLKLFSETVGDPNFLKKVVFIWDGENDRDIAQQAGIPFIHVEEEPCSFDVPYCVVSVADISGPLAQIINEKMGSGF